MESRGRPPTLRGNGALPLGYEVWLVGLHVSDKEGARRERERSGRVAGANRGSAGAAHADAEYDVEIDTTDGQLAALAQELHSKYLACLHPEAFGRLRKLAFLSRLRRPYARCASEEIVCLERASRYRLCLQ